jgi:uncharacterized protein YuzE
MNDLNCLPVPTTSPVMEIDSSCHAAYIRFTREKVYKTLSYDTAPAIVTVDIDIRGQIVGIELVGVENISISQFRSILPENLKHLDFDDARWALPSPVAA